jgi:hypothetical protein
MEKTFSVSEHKSVQSSLGGIIVSAVKTMAAEANIVIGRPGLPNVKCNLSVGGAVLYETPDGLFEVRIMSTTVISIEVLVTQISPRPGIIGGFIDKDPSNLPFSEEELKKISLSINQIKSAMSNREDITSEQLNYINRKLDEMCASSERLGRKDWINLCVGTLTSTIITVALDFNAAKALCEATSSALSWVMGSVIQLLI